MNTALGTLRLFGFYRILFKEKNGRKVNGRAEKYAAGPDEGTDICSDEIKELAMLLGVTKEQRGELEEVLNELVASGKVGISKKGKYARAEVFAQTGVFAAHHRGFGFVTIEGREDDLFIPPDDTGDAMDGDTVQVVINVNAEMVDRLPVYRLLRHTDCIVQILRILSVDGHHRHISKVHSSVLLDLLLHIFRRERLRNMGDLLHPPGKGKWRGIRAQSCGKAGYLRGEK